jgi:hypothetical protein
LYKANLQARYRRVPTTSHARLRHALAGLGAALALLGRGPEARANTPAALTYGGSGCSTSVYVVIPLLTVTGIGGLIYFLVLRKEEAQKPVVPAVAPDPKRDAAGALLYLQHLGPELAHDLALGEGNTLADVADSLSIPPAHRPALARALRTHRARLLALLDPALLTEARSVAFLAEVVAATAEVPELAADLEVWTARVAAAEPG